MTWLISNKKALVETFYASLIFFSNGSEGAITESDQYHLYILYFSLSFHFQFTVCVSICISLFSLWWTVAQCLCVCVFVCMLSTFSVCVYPSSSKLLLLDPFKSSLSPSSTGPEQPLGCFRTALGFLRRQESQRLYSSEQVWWFERFALALLDTTT